MSSLLNDPAYEPKHPPVAGAIPDVVEKWGAASQLRWFTRFLREVKPQPHEVWARFYCDSESHRGLCCVSCIEDKEQGYGDDLAGCCCEALRGEDAR